MIQRLRLAAALACALLFGAGCAEGPRVSGADRNIPRAHLDPSRIYTLEGLLPNLKATAISCRLDATGVRITGTVVNDGPVAAPAFFFGGSAVSGSDTTTLPDGVNNQVTAGLPAHSAPQDVFLAELPLSGPQGWKITFIVDPPDTQHPGGDIWEWNESDNQISAVCSCVNDPRGGLSCSIGGGP